VTPGDSAAAKVVQTAFWLRAVAAVAFHFFLGQGFFAPDEWTYDVRGDYLARYWRGEIPVDPSLSFQGDKQAYYYVVAALYFPFGALPLLPKFLNAWIGSRAVLELFRLTRLIGGSESAALKAAKFMAYFPSMILWSSVMVRDVWLQWLLLRLARELAEMKGRFMPSRVGSVAMLIWGITLFRSYLLYAAVGPFVLSFALSRSKDIVRNIFLGMGLALGLVYFGAQSGGKAVDLEELQKARSWSSSPLAADSGFGQDADVSTVGGAATFLPTALVYFFFAPFPWQLGSVSKTLAVPEALFFYTLVPGIMSGVGFLIRRRLADSIGALMVAMTLTLGYALGQGNVGTLYRHKAQVIGFYYAFAAIGMENKKRRTGLARSPAYPGPSAQPLPAGRAAFSQRTYET
jgi:hypothetical protein